MMKKKWWHDKVAYQIYPKSFQDSNGDGIGDLQGIISRLDYLKELGIDIIWLSPIYKSPFVDQGYDVADYYSIAEEFGTMEEFDQLLAETKKRGMYVVMDLVINHCSDKHEWFQKALEDPEGEYGQYFYFRKGKDGKEPNNMRGYFGGSVWEPVPGKEDLYYLHLFAKEQPDLNWENEMLRRKIYEMINWWLEKGLGGFRLDTIMSLKKDLNFPDYPVDGPDGRAACAKMVEAVDGIGDFLQEMKRETFDKYDAFTVAEVFGMKEGELESFIGENGHFQTMFDFSAQELSASCRAWYEDKPIDFFEWRKILYDTQKEAEGIGFWANIIENHDEPRGASRYLPEYAQNEAGKKMLATTYFLMRGIPFIYQGQEIGMTNCQMKDIEEYNDINTKDQYEVAVTEGCTKEEALEACYAMSRDNARTPMQWTDTAQAGFTTGNPWLKVNPNYTEINVAEQEQRADSVLHYYRKLVALRKDDANREIFTYGSFEPAYKGEEKVYAYYRKLGDEIIMVVGNFGENTCEIEIGEKAVENWGIILGNMCGKHEELEEGKIRLKTCEALVLRG